jgi:hypothetical protein
MGVDYACCDRASTAHGTCDECIGTGRHELAGRVFVRPKPAMERVTVSPALRRPVVRVPSAPLFLSHNRVMDPDSGLTYYADAGVAWMLANPEGINHPLLSPEL